MGRSLSLSSGWRSLWEPSRLLFVRQTLKPSVPNRSLPARPRGGVAAKELLLVIAVIGCAVIGFYFLDPDSNKKRDAVRAGELVSLFQREVPLGDEFVCLVSIDEYSSPGSQRSPYYMSQVRFARRNSEPSGAFLLEVIGDATPGWHKMATCRAWSLMSPEAALDYLHQHRRTSRTPSELTEPERFSALIDCLSSGAQAVTSLDEPLGNCVPTAMQESGIMLITGELGLQYVHEFQDFPLSRLAAAIRTAALGDDWMSAYTAALLPHKNMGDTALTDDEEQAIAQAFVYRLLDYLPQEASVEETAAAVDE